MCHFQNCERFTEVDITVIPAKIILSCSHFLYESTISLNLCHF